MSATAPITTMGRGIGITACAGIGPRAIGPGVTVIASGFPATTRLGTTGIIGIGRRFQTLFDEDVTDAPHGSPGRRVSLLEVAAPRQRCNHGGLSDRNPQLYFFYENNPYRNFAGVRFLRRSLFPLG